MDALEFSPLTYNVLRKISYNDCSFKGTCKILTNMYNENYYRAILIESLMNDDINIDDVFNSFKEIETYSVMTYKRLYKRYINSGLLGNENKIPFVPDKIELIEDQTNFIVEFEKSESIRNLNLNIIVKLGKKFKYIFQANPYLILLFTGELLAYNKDDIYLVDNNVLKISKNFYAKGMHVFKFDFNFSKNV